MIAPVEVFRAQAVGDRVPRAVVEQQAAEHGLLGLERVRGHAQRRGLVAGHGTRAPPSTEAAHALCVNIPADHKVHYVQPGVGHYGVFNGSRFRAEIAPRIADFVLSHTAARATRHVPVKAVAGA